MLKEKENPPIAWPMQADIQSFSGTWFVAHTKSRNEKALANELQKNNVSYFLPLIEKVYKRSRRTFKSKLPLFSGYLFFCGNEEDRLTAIKTNRIAKLIEVEDQQKLVSELLPIQKALTGGMPLNPYNYIKKGQQCRVIAGPLLGTEGIVVTEPNKTRLVLQVDILGKATCVDIDSNLLEIIDN